MVRHLKAFAFVVSIIFVACAVMPVTVATYPHTDSVRVIVSPGANKQVEALAELTRKTRKEQAACVESYGYLPTAKATWVVAIIDLGPSRPYESDSLSVWTLDGKPFCDADAASIHTHIVQNEAWGVPSYWDMKHAREWTSAPFKVVVSVPPKGPSKLTVYGLR